MVCLSVCRSITIVSPARAAEPIEMPFEMRTQVSPRNHVLDGCAHSTWLIRLNRPCTAASAVLCQITSTTCYCTNPAFGCKILTRHRASTSMYSLTFRVRVATPAQYGRNGTASLQITSHTPNLHVDFIAGACVRRALGLADYRWALPRISIMLP